MCSSNFNQLMQTALLSLRQYLLVDEFVSLKYLTVHYFNKNVACDDTLNFNFERETQRVISNKHNNSNRQ